MVHDRALRIAHKGCGHVTDAHVITTTFKPKLDHPGGDPPNPQSPHAPPLTLAMSFGSVTHARTNTLFFKESVQMLPETKNTIHVPPEFRPQNTDYRQQSWHATVWEGSLAWGNTLFSKGKRSHVAEDEIFFSRSTCAGADLRGRHAAEGVVVEPGVAHAQRAVRPSLEQHLHRRRVVVGGGHMQGQPTRRTPPTRAPR